MPRNLYNRVELVIPVSDPQCRAEVLDVLDRSLADNANAWELRSAGEWVRRTPGDPPRAVQRELIERAQARAAETTSR
jgi:polyphosphate kinase